MVKEVSYKELIQMVNILWSYKLISSHLRDSIILKIRTNYNNKQKRGVNNDKKFKRVY